MAGTGQEDDRILSGWREIAAHFGRNQSTVKRWAVHKNLPVYRAAGEAARRGLPVYAYRQELDAWLRAYANGDAQEEMEDNADPRDEAPSMPVSLRPATRLNRSTIVLACIALMAVGGAGALAWTVMAPERPEFARSQEVPEEARELYLRGTYLWNRRTPEGIAGAIDALGQAIAIHPDYAEAHASLAMAYNLARQYSGMSGWEAYPKAEEHARRAVELDPSLGFAQSVLAFVEFHWLWNVPAGLSRFEEALRLDPDSANTMMWYASSLLHVGRAAEALSLLVRAQESAPDSSVILNMKAMALFYDGQERSAVDLLREIQARDPEFAWSYPSMYYINLRQRDYPSYLRNYARLGDLIGVPRYRDAAAAGEAALAEGGVTAMADAMIAVETAYYERGEALAWDIARHHGIVGDADEAVKWLRTALERREERLIGLNVDTAFDPVRENPKFRQLAADVGLPVEG